MKRSKGFDLQPKEQERLTLWQRAREIKESGPQ
jgi:hypothetical protein